MWPFKKKLDPEQLPYPGNGVILVSDNQYFDPVTAIIVFAYLETSLDCAYGGSVSESRVQVVVYKTMQNNFVRVVRDVDHLDQKVMGELYQSDVGLYNEYFRVLRQVELGVNNTKILHDALRYERKEV